MNGTAELFALPAPAKRCYACKELKALSEFHPDRSKKRGAGYCKKCDSELRRKRFLGQSVERRRYWQSEFPKLRRQGFTDQERKRDTATAFARKIKQQYGITIDDARALLAEQNGLCGNRACGKELSLDLNGRDFRSRKHPVSRGFIDHCHKTGKVRGILCDHCNKVEGFYENNKNLLLGIFEYLKKNEATQ